MTSPNAINVDSNYARWGYDMMTAIGKAKPDASVLMVEGIAGHPIVVQERQGADKALSENSGLKVARSVNGNWTANVTKTVVLQAIATNPAPVDAVWTTGSESRVVAEAFSEAGRPAPLITGSITGDALGYWKANPDKFHFEGHAVLPGWTAQTLFRVGERMLDGQKPKLNTLLIPIPPVHGAELDKWYKDCMTADAVSVFPVPPTDPMPEEWLDAYFSNPAPTMGWYFSKGPAAGAKYAVLRRPPAGFAGRRVGVTSLEERCSRSKAFQNATAKRSRSRMPRSRFVPAPFTPSWVRTAPARAHW